MALTDLRGNPVSTDNQQAQDLVAGLEAPIRRRVVDLLEVPDVRAADGELARFDSLARELNQPFFRWLATAFRATRAQMDGRLDDVERLMHAALEEGQRAESPNALIFFGTQPTLTQVPPILPRSTTAQRCP